MSAHTASQILRRFETEQSYILNFVEFMRERTDMSDSYISEIEHKLGEHSLPGCYRRPDDRWEEDFSQSEIAELLSSIDSLRADVISRRNEYQATADTWEPVYTPGKIPDEHQELISEWIHYIMETEGRITSREDIETVRDFAVQRALHGPDYDEDLEEEILVKAIETAVEQAGVIWRNSNCAAMEVLLDDFDRIRLIARASISDAEINVMRQGFILLMTTFDAAIFDLVRIKFQNDFFGLLGTFSKDEKVSLKDVAEAGSFEKFRDNSIEKQLKGRYLRDLLVILKNIGVACTDESKGDNFVHLVELVLRRNIHVHNRGVVDERYIESDKGNNTGFNPYGLKVGDVAIIDEDYWEKAARMCDECVKRVTTWASS